MIQGYRRRRHFIEKTIILLIYSNYFVHTIAYFYEGTIRSPLLINLWHTP